VTDMRDTRSNALALAGVGLIALGLWWFLRSSGLVPSAVLDAINTGAGALTLIALGVAVIVFSRRGALAVSKASGRLYRSRDDRWLGGVLGGLGAYFGIDPLLLRVATILLTVLGAGVLVPAYIVLWIFVPEEPYPTMSSPFPTQAPIPADAPVVSEAPVAPQAPVPAQPTAAPAPPVPPVPPATEV
jgi:phage shock protein PspC (stress-responsive transcriptional regulator)